MLGLPSLNISATDRYGLPNAGGIHDIGLVMANPLGICDVAILKSFSPYLFTGNGSGANCPYIAASVYDGLMSVIIEIAFGGMLGFGINETYRPYDVQVDYENKHKANQASIAAHKSKPYSNIIWAAIAGTSNHGGGYAVDIDPTFITRVSTSGPGKGKTVAQVLKKYGFSRPASTMRLGDFPHWQHKSAPSEFVKANRVAREYYENCL